MDSLKKYIDDILKSRIQLHESVEIIYTVCDPKYVAKFIIYDGRKPIFKGTGETPMEALLDLCEKIKKFSLKELRKL